MTHNKVQTYLYYTLHARYCRFIPWINLGRTCLTVMLTFHWCDLTNVHNNSFYILNEEYLRFIYTLWWMEYIGLLLCTVLY